MGVETSFDLHQHNDLRAQGSPPHPSGYGQGEAAMTVAIKFPHEAVVDTLNKRGWTQGEYNSDSDTGPVCLHGAVRLCCPVKGDAYIIEQVFNQRAEGGTMWNDSKGRTRDEVIGLAQTCEDITDDELRSVFGPQALEIVALVRRKAVLTEGEAERLDAAWAAAAVAVATSAASDALDDAVDATEEDRHAYWAAADVADTADAAEGDAAWAAATALAARHLIGDRFTQDHYDTLTRPWREVIGPVHPDDAEATR